MPLDEFNLVCYASMYVYVQIALNFLNYNKGNLFEKYVSIITIYSAGSRTFGVRD